MSTISFKNYYNRSTSAALDGAQSVCVSPDNAHVYVAGYAKDGVAAFTREPNGDLTFIEAYQGTSAGGSIPDMDAPRAIHISPNGAQVYVVCSNSDSIVVFDRNATNGQLNLTQVVKDNVGGVSGLNGAREMVGSDDGEWVFAVASFDDAETIFKRDTVTGQLSFRGLNESGAADSPYGITMASNGIDVYVASSKNDSIITYKFNEVDFSLSVNQKLRNGVDGQGLDSVRCVVLSPDGNFLYAAGRTSDAVSCWSRAADGTLTFVAVYTDTGKGGTIQNLNSPQNLCMSNDGSTLWASAYSSDAVVVFSRDAANGELLQIESEVDGDNGVNGLNGARGMAQSPDGQFFYATGRNDDAVAVFDVN